MDDLMGIYRDIAAIGRRLGADRVVLYGSRARGDHRARSDIDLAVYGAPPESRIRFMEALEELPTLLDFDLVYITDSTDAALRESIERDGVILMDKFQEKYDKLVKAVSRLEESLAEYEAYPLETVRDGVIQRFEFCTELAWKTLREYLLDQGYTNINSPKSVMRQGYADGVLDQEQAWIALLDARNQTAHIYDESTAMTIFQQIRDTYSLLLRNLIEALKKTPLPGAVPEREM